MGWYRALLGLLLIQMAACTPVPAAKPAAGQWAIPTQTLAASVAAPAGEDLLPEPTAYLPTEALTRAAPTLAVAAPTRTPVEPTGLPAATPEILEGADAPVQATPIPIARSWREPWQYASGAVSAQGEVIYRLRYPQDWFAASGPGGSLTIQNIPPGERDLDATRPGAIRVDLHFTQIGRGGSLPPPNLKVLAAGKPGTRQILVDAAREITIWNVRLFGIEDSATTLNLSGQLSGSAAEIKEGIRLLDAMLQTLELYAWPDPLPAPVLEAYSPAEGWQKYSGRLEAEETSLGLTFRFPHGWWAYPSGGQFLDVTNYVIDPRASVPEPDEAGAIKLSFSAADCAVLGSCPVNPPLLGSGRYRGVREVYQSPEGYTFWTVRIYHEQKQLTLLAVLVGPDRMVERGILALNMLLATLEIYP